MAERGRARAVCRWKVGQLISFAKDISRLAGGVG